MGPAENTYSDFIKSQKSNRKRQKQVCDISLKVNLSWCYLRINIICLAAESLACNKHRIIITNNPRGLKYAKMVIADRKFL